MYQNDADCPRNPLAEGQAQRPRYIPYEVEIMEKLTGALEDNILKLAERLAPLVSAKAIDGAGNSAKEDAPAFVILMREHNKRLAVMKHHLDNILQGLEI